MKFEINSQFDPEGEESPWGITGFNMYTETRTFHLDEGDFDETYWVIEINSIEELLELCKQLKPRVYNDMDIAILLEKPNPYNLWRAGSSDYPLIRIHDFFFE